MTKQFNGKIAVDIRDSVPDWAPFLAPRHGRCATNVLYLVWDDLGFATMDMYGGPVSVSEHASHRRQRCEVLELPHDSIVFADASILAHRPQRHDERDGDDCGFASGFPGI